MVEGSDFQTMILEMNVVNSIFYNREMLQPKYHWVEIKNLHAIQKQHRQLFFKHNASKYTSAFASAITACQHELERMQKTDVLHGNNWVDISNKSTRGTKRKEPLK